MGLAIVVKILTNTIKIPTEIQQISNPHNANPTYPMVNQPVVDQPVYNPPADQTVVNSSETSSTSNFLGVQLIGPSVSVAM